MNKYSSKAIKTAATVGMSLAMVLSAVPATPVFAATAACDADAVNAHKNYLLALDSFLSINLEKLTTSTKSSSLIGADGLGVGETKVIEYLNGAGKEVLDYFVATNGMASECADSYNEFLTNRKKAQNIVDTVNGITTLVSKITAAQGVVDSATSTTSVRDLISALDTLTDSDANDYLDYTANLTDTQKSDMDQAISELNDLIGSSDVVASDLKAYVKDLQKGFKYFTDTTALGTSAITKNDVDKAIKAIKKGGTFGNASDNVALTALNYKLYGENEAVVTIIEELEAMYDEITEVKDATKATNAATKALTKGTKSVMDKVKLFSSSTDEIVWKLSTSDYKVLKDYKEEVVDAVWTMKNDVVGGYDYDDSAKSLFATQTQVNTALGRMVNAELSDTDDIADTFLFGYDDKDEMYGWDVLVEHMEEIAKAQETIKKLENMDAVTLVASDRDVLNEIDNAVYFLRTDAEENLNYSETKDAKAAERKITELMEAYRIKFGSINSNLNGWVNKGNGDYAYYENGNAVTKWVASGSDWYYVKGGNMLRNSWIASDAQGTKWYYVDDAGKMVSNTTVNGYTFNSYGVWVK